VVDGAQAAYDSVAELRREPAGLVRISSPVLLTQRCLAHVLPGYMTANPRVSVFVEATDQTVNVIEERFDIAIRAKSEIEDVAGLVAKTLGNSQRVLVVSPAFLERYGRPENPADLPRSQACRSFGAASTCAIYVAAGNGLVRAVFPIRRNCGGMAAARQLGTVP
jgi:DNA-binding transcriptional LysR family regulator